MSKIIITDEPATALPGGIENVPEPGGNTAPAADLGNVRKIPDTFEEYELRIRAALTHGHRVGYQAGFEAGVNAAMGGESAAKLEHDQVKAPV